MYFWTISALCLAVYTGYVDAQLTEFTQSIAASGVAETASLAGSTKSDATTLTVAENFGSGTISTFTAAGGTGTWSTDVGTISGTGVFSMSALDYETDQSHTVTITYTEGGIDVGTITLTLTVTDVLFEGFTQVVTSPATDTVALTGGITPDATTITLAEDFDTGTITTLGVKDANGVLTFQSSDAAIGVTNGGVVTAASLDYETDTSLAATITVTDNAVAAGTIVLTLTVTDVLFEGFTQVVTGPATETVVLTGGTTTDATTVTLAEDFGTGTITTLGVKDANGALTFQSSDASIDVTDGGVVTAASLDYETDTSLAATITVTDNAVAAGTIVLTLTVTDVLFEGFTQVVTSPATETVVLTGGTTTDATTITLAEDFGTGTITTLGVKDANGALTFQSDNAAIGITNGGVVTAASLDYETDTSLAATVTVTDNGVSAGTIALTLTVTDVEGFNQVVTGPASETVALTGGTTTDATTITLAEDFGTGTITTLGVKDANGALTFQSSDAAIGVTDGGVVTAASLDYETDTSLAATITVTDNAVAAGTIVLTLTVTDVLFEGFTQVVTGPATETVVLTGGTTTDATTITLAEDFGTGTITTLGVKDANGALTFQSDNAAIGVTNGGVVTAASLDYETDTSLAATITVTDSGVAAGTIVLTLTLIDLNDADPVFSPTAYAETVTHGSVAGTTVTTVTGSDTDGAQFNTVTYEISDGNTGDVFEVTSGGVVKIAAGKTVDRATLKAYALIVLVKDAGVGVAQQTGTTTVVIGVCESTAAAVVASLGVLLLTAAITALSI